MVPSRRLSLYRFDVSIRNVLISMIAAIDKNRLIGNGPDIPWQMPADRRHFRRMTLGKPVVMGRKTFETLKSPLGKRLNIILTFNKNYRVTNHIHRKSCVVVHSMDEVLDVAGDCEELMICGGAPIYETFLPYAHRLYLTQIHHVFEGNVYFPAFDMAEWQEVKRIDRQSHQKNPYPYSFIFLERSL